MNAQWWLSRRWDVKDSGVPKACMNRCSVTSPQPPLPLTQTEVLSLSDLSVCAPLLCLWLRAERTQG
uniref:Uncharacterized protein n=1 Tax=Knipowitschia caucasica TaxID=637954 RepID=A0AAV2L3G2_KNICA